MFLVCSDDDEGDDAVSRLRFRAPQGFSGGRPDQAPNPTSSPVVSIYLFTIILITLIVSYI